MVEEFKKRSGKAVILSTSRRSSSASAKRTSYSASSIPPPLGTSLPGRRVIRVLNDLVAVHGGQSLHALST
jgi:hypothetical protein